MKKGFTLAEVLITLGIIGVVAALTIPSLITKHKRHVAEVKLQKFYSVINNAMKMIEENYGEISEVTTSNTDTTSFSKEFYEKYFTPYMNNVVITRKSLDNYVVFADGSGFKVRNYFKELEFLYYIDMNIFNVKEYYKYIDKYQFYFQYVPGKHIVAPYGIYTYYYENLQQQYEVEQQKRRCYNGYPMYCAAVIQRNGWKIPKDYPHIK